MANRYALALPATTLSDITAGGLAAGKGGSYLLNLVNRAGTDRSVRVAVTTGAAVTLADYVEYDAPLAAAGSDGNVLSRWPIPLGEGWKVFVYASDADVSAVLIGQED